MLGVALAGLPAFAGTAEAATRPVVTQDWFYVGGHYIDTRPGKS